jgi:hypothetical protein
MGGPGPRGRGETVPSLTNNGTEKLELGGYGSHWAIPSYRLGGLKKCVVVAIGSMNMLVYVFGILVLGMCLFFT